MSPGDAAASFGLGVVSAVAATWLISSGSVRGSKWRDSRIARAERLAGDSQRVILFMLLELAVMGPALSAMLLAVALLASLPPPPYHDLLFWIGTVCLWFGAVCISLSLFRSMFYFDCANDPDSLLTKLRRGLKA
jgi:hypothetical protein